MTSNRIERRSFLKLVAAGTGATILPLPLLSQIPGNADTSALPKFKMTEPEWILHSDGTFDLIAGSMRLRNCRPTIDGQSIFVRNTFMGDSPKGKRIIYELDRGFVMLDLKINRGSVSIGAELSSISRAPFWFCPLGEARIEGVTRFYKQGLGFGGQSGIFDIQRQTAQEWGNVTGEQAWSYDSYLTTALMSRNYETLAFSAYDHTDFLQKSTIYNRPHRKGLLDRYPDREEIFFETGFVMENIPLKDDFIKLPDIYVVQGNRPYETLQYIAWNISENMVARKDTKTSYHWSSWYESKKDFSFEMLQEQLTTLDKTKPAIQIQTIQIDDCYTVHGDWLNTNDKWPKSMEDAARAIFQRGYRAGIWIAPFMVDEHSKLFRNHPNWLIKDLDGNPIPEWQTPEGNHYVLDGSHPDVQRYLAKVFRSFRKMGFTFFKTDFLDWGLKDSINIKRYNKDKTSVQILVEVLNLIREEIGAGSYWLASISPFAPLIGIVDGMRVSNDVESAWTMYGVRNMFQETYNCQYFNNVFWQNDPDVIYLRDVNTQLTETEKLTIARWNGILGGVVHTSDRFSSLTEKQLNFWRFLQPQDRPQSAELPFWGLNKKCKVAVRRFKSPRAWAVLFVNDMDVSVQENFTMPELIGEESCWTFEWDLDQNTSYGNLSNFTMILDKHESKLLYLTNGNNPPPPNLTISGIELPKE
ncbi:MAG: glycoside hydrolase family 36 protein [Mangrovibacterium sp.]